LEANFDKSIAFTVSIDISSGPVRPRPRREDFRRAGNYWIADLSERLRGPIRRVGLGLSGGIPPSPPRQWRKGLILGPSHIGDVLYNTASLPALRAGLPDCEWSYAVSEASAEVLRGNPHLHEVIPLDDSGAFPARLARHRAALASHHFDVAIAYASGSSWQDLTLAAFLGIPNRVGYVHKGFSGLVTHPVSLRCPQPFPAYFRDLVSQISGRPAEDISSLRPLVYPDAEHDRAVDQVGARLGIDWNKQPILACSVTSRQPSGIWPQENFLQCLHAIRRGVACTVVYLGAKSDEMALNHLAGQTGADSFVVAGNLDLRAVVALLRRCRAALTTDSGPRHLANAAGLPVVFVRNIGFRAEEAGAYCETDHDMAPRELELVLPAQQAAAWAQIDPQAVGEEVVRLLRRG